MARSRRGYHEDFGREASLEPGSVRGFAVVMTVAFVIIGLWLSLKYGRPAWLPLAVAFAFAAAGLFRPQILSHLNRWWFRLGLLMGAIVAPLMMGLIFYGVVTPIGWLRRLCGGDSLALRRDPEATSYWIDRQPPGPKPEQLDRQY
jgi:hypothetical protein